MSNRPENRTAALSGSAGETVDEVLAFITQDGCTDDQFDRMALRLFAYQYSNNLVYRRFCQRRGAVMRNVMGWRDIPAVPINAFAHRARPVFVFQVLLIEAKRRQNAGPATDSLVGGA